MARWQLLARGVTRHQIAVRLAAGRLHEVHRGVYLVGHEVPPPYALESAAILVFRGTATLSHQTAAALWGLIPTQPPSRCVTVPPGCSRNRPRIEAYRANLARRDVRRRQRLPLTSPPRTILDLSSSMEDRDLEALVAEAHYRRLARESELRNQIERHRRKRGTARLRRVLDLPGGPRRTRSEAERWLLALLRREGVVGYETNAQVAGYEVDFLWRDHRLVVEVDAYDAHSGRAAFERDRMKVANLTAAGHRVMLVTGRQVRDDAAGVVGRIRSGLAARLPPEPIPDSRRHAPS